jgi:hypothetical protein
LRGESAAWGAQRSPKRMVASFGRRRGAAACALLRPREPGPITGDQIWRTWMKLPTPANDNWPIVLTRPAAAAMCRIGVSTWVRKGILPGPMHGTRRWSRIAIEQTLSSTPSPTRKFGGEAAAQVIRYRVSRDAIIYGGDVPHAWAVRDDGKTKWGRPAPG